MLALSLPVKANVAVVNADGFDGASSRIVSGATGSVGSPRPAVAAHVVALLGESG